ncbi:MAG: hypothetical protein HYZ44_06890 [Bacteroidetes bacterium]|nr:hypothetical protein [Bacteroidota bacterium]
MENTISIEIPADVVKAVSTKFAEIEALIKPYTVRVSDDDKGSLLKIGDKTIPFVDKVQGYTVSAPEFTPPYLDVREFNRDKTALTSLDKMAQPGQQVISMINDTLALAANDSYAAALVYYNSVKQAASNGVAKAKPIYEDLAQRFPGRSKSTAKAPTSTK